MSFVPAFGPYVASSINTPGAYHISHLEASAKEVDAEYWPKTVVPHPDGDQDGGRGTDSLELVRQGSAGEVATAETDEKKAHWKKALLLFILAPKGGILFAPVIAGKLATALGIELTLEAITALFMNIGVSAMLASNVRHYMELKQSGEVKESLLYTIPDKFNLLKEKLKHIGKKTAEKSKEAAVAFNIEEKMSSLKKMARGGVIATASTIMVFYFFKGLSLGLDKFGLPASGAMLAQLLGILYLGSQAGMPMRHATLRAYKNFGKLMQNNYPKQLPPPSGSW